MEEIKGLISVVIPVYNGEKYIQKPIESLKNQTYTNFEVYLIDDCSKDDSVGVIKELIGNDERFHLIQREQNQGNAVKNIEYAIQFLKGEWFFYMSHDDFIDADFFEKSLKKADETGSNCVVPNLIFYFNHLKMEDCPRVVPKNSGNDYNSRISNIEGYKMSLDWEKFYIHAFHLKKLSIVRKLNWNSHLIAGDEVLHRQYFFNSNHIVFVDTNYYYDQNNSQSITKALRPSLLQFVESYFECLKFIWQNVNLIGKCEFKAYFKYTIKALRRYRNMFEQSWLLLSEDEKTCVDKYLSALRNKMLKFAFSSRKFEYILKIIRYSKIRKGKILCK